MKEKNSGIPINQEEIQLYLKDIRKIKVMTPERERELSKLITSGTLTENEIKEISAKSLLIPTPTPTASNKCPSCGFTSEDVRKTGRLGCGDCYGIFSSLLQDVLNDCQKGTRHAGKVPKSLRKPSKKRLQEDLSTAVGKEQFEEAARIRDELGKIGEEG